MIESKKNKTIKVLKKPLKVSIIDMIGDIHDIEFRRFEYPNLMELITESYYEEIGECRGRGLCKTCFVSSKELVKNKNINFIHQPTTEKQFLSCQILVDEKIDGMTFRVLSND